MISLGGNVRIRWILGSYVKDLGGLGFMENPVSACVGLGSLRSKIIATPGVEVGF